MDAQQTLAWIEFSHEKLKKYIFFTEVTAVWRSNSRNFRKCYHKTDTGFVYKDVSLTKSRVFIIFFPLNLNQIR